MNSPIQIYKYNLNEFFDLLQGLYMPTVSLPLSNINKSIISNSIYHIANEISEIIKVNNILDIITMYNGREITFTDNKVNIKNEKLDNIPTTISSKRMLVNIVDNYNEDSVNTTATHQNEYYPIFIDHDLDVTIKPIYIDTDYNIEFTYITPSKSEIAKIVDDLRMRMSMTRNLFIHDIEYDYSLSDIVEDFIIDIYNNKNRLFPQPLDQYFKEHSSNRIYIGSDLIGENNTLLVREIQTRIVGMFDFTAIPDKPEHDSGMYKFTFSYKFTINKPSHLVLQYPILVANKLLPNKYIEFLLNKNNKEERKKHLSYSNSLYALSNFEAHRQLENRIDINLPINIPEIDDFKIKSIHKGYSILVSFMSEVNETNKKDLFNLKEIDPFYVREEILDYINLEKNYVVSPYSSFIYLGLQYEGKYFNADILNVDNDYNIKSVVELPLYRPSRVLLNLIVDISILTHEVVVRLLTYDIRIIKAIIQEFIFNYVNHKNLTDKIQDITLFSFFITVFYNLIKKDENNRTDIIEILFYMKQMDDYLHDKILGIIVDNYPDEIYKPLFQTTKIIKSNSINFKNFMYDKYLTMKTVQSSYIVALRRN